MQYLDSVERCVDAIIARVGKDLRVATPLGLGKPNHLLNALYRRVQGDPGLSLQIYTGLTLSRPTAKHDLEQRLVQPILERVFADFPELDYEVARVRDALPDNVRVFEFFLQPGRYLGVSCAQRDYISTNYTYVARDLVDRGVNVLMTLVAAEGEPGARRSLSLSCNADLSVELVEALLEKGATALSIAQTHGQLPFLYGDAELEPALFDLIVDEPRLDYTLFGPPKDAVTDADVAIGLYASTLVRDGGELQIGIGSLGDAVAYALQLRQRSNAHYQQALQLLEAEERVGASLIATWGGTAALEQGLFAATEMFADAYRHLWEAGILTRRVYDDARLQRLLNEGVIGERISPDTLRVLWERGVVGPVLREQDLAYLQRWGVLRPTVSLTETGALRFAAGEECSADLRERATWDALCDRALGEQLRGGCCVHAGFILGPQALYQWLRDLPEDERRQISMRSIGRINQLYGHEPLDRLHRRAGRFLNTAMMVTLSGAIVSDGLEDGRTVSGVGGQYNFVAMAHALPDGRSVIQLRAARRSQGQWVSNIVPRYGHTTVARHQRDLVVTEYGVADLRGRTDEEVIIALLQIADSRFQSELIEAAQRSGKLAASYQLPERYRNNLPEVLAQRLGTLRREGLFPLYPFGTELTHEEQVLAEALKRIQGSMASLRGKLKAGAEAVLDGGASAGLLPYLARVGLDAPSSPLDHTYRRLLVSALHDVLQDSNF